MAYYTGPDFRTGIPGLINNTTDTTTKTTDPETRYGERIGDDGYLRKGPFTADYIDTDGDGIDDRQQAGPGQPEIGSNLDGSPIFGIDNPPPFISQQTGGEGDVLGQFPGVQGQNDPLNPANNQRYSYESYNGKTFKVDNITGEVEEFNGFLGTAGILGSIIGNFRNIRNAPPNVQAAYSNALSRDQRNVDLDNRVATNPETYGYTGPVAKTGLLGLLGTIGKEGLKGKGTKETTEAAAKEAAKTEKEITDATKQATKDFQKNKGSNNKGPGAGGTVDKGGKSKGSGGYGGLGDGAGGACFEPNTYIKMHDGSEKKIKDVQLGDITKGGKVTGVLQFEPIDDIHEYKGVVVAGSHFVKEGNEFIMVQDSPESIKIDKIPVVYSLDTTNRRIFINDIEFADYNGDGIAKNFLNNAGMDLSGFDKEVLRQVEHRLI